MEDSEFMPFRKESSAKDLSTDAVTEAILDNLSGPEAIQSYEFLYNFLAQTFYDTPYSILELGCGAGALCHWLQSNADYVGVERSWFAVKEARRTHPQREFVRSDLSSFLCQVLPEKRRYDVIIFSRLYWDYSEEGRAYRPEPMPLLDLTVERLLKRDGYLAFYEPFTYCDDEPHTLQERAPWVLSLLERVVEGLDLRHVLSGHTLQSGAEERILGRRTPPPWYSDGVSHSTNRFIGRHLATWTVIKQRVND